VVELAIIGASTQQGKRFDEFPGPDQRKRISAHALDGFTPTAPFNLKNAQAMMWLSQLAYETPKNPRSRA
jgi:hypothetical protein